MWRVLKPTIMAAFAAAIFTAAAQTASRAASNGARRARSSPQNSLLPANVIYQMVQKRTGGKVVNQALCDVGGGFVYKLVVLGPTGEVTNVTVDARTGQF